jgi:hypothetical protein
LFCNTFHTADPFTAITEDTDALDVMRTLEGRDEKVPCVGETQSVWGDKE